MNSNKMIGLLSASHVLVTWDTNFEPGDPDTCGMVLEPNTAFLQIPHTEEPAIALRARGE